MSEILVQSSILLLILACIFGFFTAYEACANDVANAIGPLAAVNGVVQKSGVFTVQSELPLWILLLGGGGIVVRLSTLGYRVIATFGRNITELAPSRGCTAELVPATTVVIAS